MIEDRGYSIKYRASSVKSSEFRENPSNPSNPSNPMNPGRDTLHEERFTFLSKEVHRALF